MKTLKNAHAAAIALIEGKTVICDSIEQADCQIESVIFHHDSRYMQFKLASPVLTSWTWSKDLLNYREKPVDMRALMLAHDPLSNPTVQIDFPEGSIVPDFGQLVVSRFVKAGAHTFAAMRICCGDGDVCLADWNCEVGAHAENHNIKLKPVTNTILAVYSQWKKRQPKSERQQ